MSYQKEYLATITMKHILLIFILWLSTPHLSEACSCFGASDFISTVTNKDYPPDLIVRGVKTGDHHYGMRFMIKEVLKGQLSQSTITVWGDNGGLCRVYTSGFSTGEELVLALYKTDQMGNRITVPEYPENLEKAGDYHLSVCGVHFVRVENNRMSGAITESQSYMNYADFKELLGVHKPMPAEGEAFLIYPNPAPFGQFKIAYQLSDADDLTISVYNVIGSEVKNYQVALLSDKGTIEIDAQDISKGIYFIDIQAKGYRHRQKILVL